MTARETGLDPAFRLLVAAVAWPRSPARDAAVRDAAEGVDWDAFVATVRRHRMAALAADGLARAGLQPPAGLKALATADVRAVLALIGEAGRIQALFAAAAIPMAIVKGPALSVIAFGDLGRRQCRDIDVLVDPADAARALDLLEAAGFVRMGDPPPDLAGDGLLLWRELQKDVTLRSPNGGPIVELHHRLTLNPHLMPQLGPADATRTVQVAGVAMRTFEDDDLFAYLCAHGASHAWFRLKWLADIGALLGDCPPERIQALYEIAAARGLARAAGSALVLCRRLWGLELPPALAARLDADPRVRRLEAIALDALSGPTVYERRFGGTITQASQFLINDSWAFRWAQLRRAWIEWPLVRALPLPRPLHFVYATAKPFVWLWRKAFHGR